MSTTKISRSSPLSSPHASGINGVPYNNTNAINTGSSINFKSASPQIHTPKPQASVRASATADASPNYFNLAVDSSKTCISSEMGAHTRTNWSPPSSRVRSTAAISPLVIPLDQNPDFAEFRRQSELRSQRNGFSVAFNAPSPKAPGIKRLNSAGQPSPPDSAQASTPASTKVSSGVIETTLPEEKPRSPKRTLSSPYTNISGERPRRNSPAGFTEREAAGILTGPSSPNRNTESVAFALNPTIMNTLASQRLPSASKPNAPSSASGTQDSNFISTGRLANLLKAEDHKVLLLDLRVSTQYARSRIRGALSLCIPTTLLKRPAYNIDRLAETFTHSPEQKAKFENWQSCEYIVVYDASSSKIQDAGTCVNMLKKFSAAGWKNKSYIIEGGFARFARSSPQLVEYDLTSRVKHSSGAPAEAVDSLAPVIGGCPMPVTQNAANPFFGNIRQNMDLIGGVGQITVRRPKSLSSIQLKDIPQWLLQASEPKDNGQAVAERFLDIEKKEQKRMQSALSGEVFYNAQGTAAQNAYQIAGIEKGSKNRYNNIWPYEHSRVKLQGAREDGCDYINASHVQAPWSNKTYIATQGPKPSTFEDFWTLVWQQDVRVIVMLTAETEGGQVKADNYWNQREYGKLRLTPHSEIRASLEPDKIHRHRERAHASRRSSHLSSHAEPHEEISQSAGDEPYVIVRRFTLMNASEPFGRPREITQLQYSSWPDFGAPAHPAHVLGLVEQCNAVIRASNTSMSDGPVSEDPRPILVHCSAGCGRTGTFCTVDSVIDMLRRQRTQRGTKSAAASTSRRDPTPMDLDASSASTESLRNSDASSGGESISAVAGVGERNWIVRDDLDLVAKTVEDFRHQRLSMVQNLRQFVLCYEAVLEWYAEQMAA